MKYFVSGIDCNGVLFSRGVASNGLMLMCHIGFQFTHISDLRSVTTVARCFMALFVRVSSVKVSPGAHYLTSALKT